MSEVEKGQEKGPYAPESNPEIGEVLPVDADRDEALEFLQEKYVDTDGVVVDHKKFLRKIDWRIVPMMWGCYFLQYMDKTLINYGAVMGLETDTHMSGNQFSLIATLFYVTYLCTEAPTGYLMQRLPTAKYLATNVILWGLCTALMCVSKNFATVAALRLLLGCFESVVAPSCILFSSMWYLKNEQPPRIAIWYLGTGSGSIFGAIMSFGFQHYHGSTFKSWQIMFLVIGLLTICLGIVMMIFLPDNPMKAKFLTREEKVYLIERLRQNQTGIENKHFKKEQVFECLKDPKTWMLCLLTILTNIPNGATSSYQATIIKNFGFTSEQTSLLSIPSGFVTIGSIMFASIFAAKQSQIAIWIVLLLLPTILGAGLLSFLPASKIGGLLMGNYLTGCQATLPLTYSWVAANYAGHTKKVTMNAVLLMSFCIGNIIGPETFQDRNAPNYIPWENRKRDRNEEGMAIQDYDLADLTDQQNRAFRYRL